MEYMNLLETIEYKDKSWWKMKEDGVFQMILTDWYESYGNFFCKYVKNKGVVVQAGGYCGINPRMFSELFETVYTFEPDPMNFFCLTLNCQNDNVIKNQAALGKNHEMISVIRTHRENKGMNKTYPLFGSNVPTFKIDDLKLTACDLIQLDVEGYETNILHGAVDVISKFKPVITVEDTNEHIEDLLIGRFKYKQMETLNRDTVYVYEE